MQDIAFAQRIIETADEYYFTAEEQWGQLIELEPTDEESLFEFKRIIRAALLFYARAYLELDLVETDESQSLEDLLEIIAESRPDVQEFFESNKVMEKIAEEGTSAFSSTFAASEAVRSILLENSGELAATLHKRFLQLENNK